MNYFTYLLIPALCILIPLLTLILTLVTFRVVSRRKRRFVPWPLMVGLPLVGYVTYNAWRIWQGFWMYMNCSSC